MNNNIEVSISVVIPIYNGEEWIKRCILSVISQRVDNIEIICIDDGSTDRSFEILKKLEKEYNNLMVITQENQGVSVTRNTGIKNATGRWIAFLDVDDVWLPNIINKQKIKEWERNEFDLIAFKNCNSNEKITRFQMKGERQKQVILGGNSSIWCVSDHMGAMLYSRNIIDKYKIHFYEDLKYGEDTIFRLTNLYLSNKIYIENDTLYVYVKNKKSAMHTLKIEAVPYYESIIKGYLRMQTELNALKIIEKGEMTFGTDAAWIYLLDMAIAQCESLKGMKAVDEFQEKYSKIYQQKSYKLYEKQLKELDLMKNHRLIFECKYWFIGIVKYNFKKFYSLSLVYTMVERLKYRERKQIYDREELRKDRNFYGK